MKLTLKPEGLAVRLRGKMVEIYDFPDGRLEVRWKGRSLPYSAFASRGDITKLQAYVRSCTVCASKTAANAEIISIARQKCDRTFAAAFDLDVPKSTPPMRDTAAFLDDELQ